MMSVLMGLDLGEKRVGVAITDEMGMIAMPLATIRFNGFKSFLQELKPLLDEHSVAKMVVGHPISLRGEVGPAAQKVQAVVEKMKQHLSQPIVLWDERLSTAEAQRVLLDADVSREKRKQIVDRLAAQRILQSYVDSQAFRDRQEREE